MLHLFLVVTRLLKRRDVSAHTLPATGNMILLCGSDGSHGFTTFARAAGLGFVTQLISPFLWLDNELGESKVPGSRADRYAPLQQLTCFEAYISPMHGGTLLDSAELHLYPQ